MLRTGSVKRSLKSSAIIGLILLGSAVNSESNALGQQQPESSANEELIDDSQPFMQRYVPYQDRTSAPQPKAEPTNQPTPTAETQWQSFSELPKMEQPKKLSRMPTVIVRPPADSPTLLNELTVDVERITTDGGDEYALKLSIPESIKLIEVSPVATGGDRNFRIRVAERGSDYLAALDSPTNSAQAPDANPIPAQPVSAPGPAAPQMMVPRFNKPVPQRSAPRPGFQQNPFYRSLISDQQRNTASTVPAAAGYMQANLLTTNVPDSETDSSQQASFEAPTSASVPTTSVQPAEQAQVVSEMYGPSLIEMGDTGDFVVYLANPTNKTVEEARVQLSIPSGLDVTVLDREATVDVDARLLTWKFPTLAPGEEHFIRYRVASISEGSQSQEVSVILNDDRLTCEFETTVLPAEDSVAPLLPFESE